MKKDPKETLTVKKFLKKEISTVLSEISEGLQDEVPIGQGEPPELEESYIKQEIKEQIDKLRLDNIERQVAVEIEKNKARTKGAMLLFLSALLFVFFFITYGVIILNGIEGSGFSLDQTTLNALIGAAFIQFAGAVITAITAILTNR
jgi:hypothetical protein